MSIFPSVILKKIRSQDGSSIDSTLLPGQEEPEKVVVTDSVFAALRRCAVHIVPIAVSITIMTLNIKGTFLGADLMYPVRSETINLLLLQLAAKAHEITIVSSLGIIVLQFVRHELLFGDGLPLGLLGSGITFNNFEFFFQKEFYGGLKYVAFQGNKRHKIMFISLVILAGLIAALAGPSSAVLVVPKSQDWKAGGTPFFLNGSESELWPEDLSGELPELQQMCMGENSTHLALCPAAGFYSLWTHWGTVNHSTFRTQDVRPYARELSGSRFYWPISSPSSLIPPLYVLGTSQRGPNGGTSLVEPHAATVVILQKLAEDWWDAVTTRNDLSAAQMDDRLVSAKFKNAMTIARCAKPQKLSVLNKTVYFPSMDGVINNFADNLPVNVGHLNTSSTKHLRFQWTHLPSKFGPASIGGLFESPWDNVDSSEPYRAVVACTIQAGWVPATVFTDKYAFWTGWYPWNILFGDRTPKWDSTSNNSTNGRVALGDDWLRLLTPPTPVNSSDSGPWTPSTIESMFLNAGLAGGKSRNVTDSASPADWLSSDDASWQRVSLVEAIVCSVVLDGLSRTASYRAFDTSDTESGWTVANYKPLPDFKSLVLKHKLAMQPPDLSPEKFTTIQAEMKTSGFSLQASLASFLAMSVLLVHIALAAGHIIYVLCQRRTSKCWNSVGELIALSQNSEPAFGILSNTGGGIKRSSTYSHVARIRARKTLGSSDQQHLELLFDDNFDPPRDGSHLSSRELIEVRGSLARHSATWPNNQTSVSLTTEEYVWDASASTERLAAHSSLEARETAMVAVNRRYG